MEKLPELYFKTGEFANILGVKKHTLFHYDEVGVFSPAIKRDNDYRYYFLWQIETFGAIRTLQKLGMSLGEIKDYMDSRSPETFLSLAAEKEKEIDREIERLKSMKRFIRREMEHMAEGVAAETDAPFLEEVPEEHILGTYIDGGEEAVAKEIAEQMKYSDSHGLGLYSAGGACDYEDLKAGRFDHYALIYTKPDKKLHFGRLMVKPAGTYAVLYYKGYYGNMEHAFRLLKHYLEEQRLMPEGLWYEDLILDELTVKGYDDYVVKVSVRTLTGQ